METHAYQPAATDTFPDIPKSYIEDNYTTHIFKNVKNTPGNDLIISAHPNGIAFITLAPSHAAFATTTHTDSLIPDKEASSASISFDVGYQQPGEASGKSLLDATFTKGRGPMISPNQPLCKLHLLQILATTLPLSSAAETGGPNDKIQDFLVTLPLVKGSLVEINQKLVNLKGKALLDVLKDEYIAIIELKHSELATLREATSKVEAEPAC